MRSVRLTTGREVPLDGDLLALLEALYREVTLKHHLQVSFDDMMKEMRGLVAQMSEEDRKSYLVESLFLNSVTYENEILDAYVRKLTVARKKGRGRAAGRSL
jgi:predicted metal-binding protein